MTEGVHTASIKLLEQYAVGNVTMAGDGHGGTVIGDPPAVAQTDSRPAALVNQRHMMRT